MSGHIQKRGNSWRLKFDAERDPATGERRVQYVTFKGTKAEAKAKLIELLASVGAGTFVETNKVTVGDFVKARIEQWQAKGILSARSADRYRELLVNQIAPHLGSKMLQKLRPIDIEQWHTALLTVGLAPRTVAAAHKVVSKSLNDAVKN